MFTETQSFAEHTESFETSKYSFSCLLLTLGIVPFAFFSLLHLKIL